MNPRCDSRDPRNTGIRCGLDVGHMGEHTTMMRTRSWSGSPDYDMDGGVTAAAIEADVVSPERARSLVQENAHLRALIERAEAYAAEAIAEAQAEATAAVTRAEKAEENVRAREEMINRLAATASPRPLTSDDITDEMVDRYFEAMKNPGSNYDEAVRNALRAALTPPPSRPEGAEEIEALLRQAWDRTIPFESPTESAWGLADFLAERGVRVTGAES